MPAAKGSARTPLGPKNAVNSGHLVPRQRTQTARANLFRLVFVVGDNLADGGT